MRAVDLVAFNVQLDHQWLDAGKGNLRNTTLKLMLNLTPPASQFDAPDITDAPGVIFTLISKESRVRLQLINRTCGEALQVGFSPKCRILPDTFTFVIIS